MIEKIRIRNFKSLVDFQLELSVVTCLVGNNQSGKTNVLNVLDFMCKIASSSGDFSFAHEYVKENARFLTFKKDDSKGIFIDLKINGKWYEYAFNVPFSKKTMEMPSEVEKSLRNLSIFDEAGHNVFPDNMRTYVKGLLSREDQVICATHNPVFLNWLDDDVAKESVVLIFKDQEGKTGQTKYFSHPVTLKKLEVLGPGEVFLDTHTSDILLSKNKE